MIIAPPWKPQLQAIIATWQSPTALAGGKESCMASAISVFLWSWRDIEGIQSPRSSNE
jgi:hypothetical protein